MKKYVKYGVIVLIVGLFVFTLFFLYQKSKPKVVEVQTKTPFVGNVIKKTVATGSVVPRKEIEIKPKVSGIIETIYIVPGQRIKKGDLIAKVKIIPDMVNLNNAESRVSRAKLSFDDSKIEFDRQKKLFDQGVIPEAEFQKVRLAFNTAKEELGAAESNLELIREGVVKKSGQATNTLVRSTIDGMVLDVPVEEGNQVIEANTFNSGTTIAFVADMGEMIFKGKVDETEVGKIKQGMKLLLSVGAIEKEKFDAELEYISPKGKEENGAIQFEIKAKIKLKDNLFIRSGYSANADIVLDRRDSVLCIEEGLLQFKGDSAYVEVQKVPQQFEKRFIQTGLSDGINIEILKGLKKTDKIKVKS
ncbi:MAG TPA: efflux RND transporter periplasmic adaptor subunit [Bacteroidales bacterium]|nr:efflux RND transporter periplasmic adaptor subunit [Bacteroidales bacterium]